MKAKEKELQKEVFTSSNIKAESLIASAVDDIYDLFI